MRKMTKEQRDWCKNYRRETGFEPLMDDFYNGDDFFPSALKSVRWFEDWANDAHLNVSRRIPGQHEERATHVSKRSGRPKAKAK